VPDRTEGDLFGVGLVGLDFNADGFDDLAVGVAGEDQHGLVDEGLVQVLYGSASGLQTVSPPVQSWSQESAGVRDSAESDDFFGLFQTGLDFNGDGWGDLATFAGEEDIGGVPDVGAANVLYGSDAGLQATSPDDQFWSQDSPSVKDSGEDLDCWGCFAWLPEYPP
jgi:hypothetical protein